jgi:heme-degrading monooxygenase HmoA
MTFIAMNRFKVDKTRTNAFEAMWQQRDSYLDEMAGFVSFHLLRGPEREDHVLYSSHTVWASREHFEAWTRSEQFRKSHARAGDKSERVFLEHPQFEGFEAVQTLVASGKAAA